MRATLLRSQSLGQWCRDYFFHPRLPVSSQVSARWAAAHARPLLTPRCDQRLLLLLWHRNRQRGALPGPTALANQVTVRGVDIIDKMVRRDAPPFTSPTTTRAFVFARGVIFGEVIGAPKSRPMSFFGAGSLFQDTADRFCQCFGTYRATIHRPCQCVDVV